MVKIINGIQYNVDAISQMNFEEFRSTCTGQSEDKIANVWREITGKEPEIEKKEKKEIKPKKEKVEFSDEKEKQEIKE